MIGTNPNNLGYIFFIILTIPIILFHFKGDWLLEKLKIENDIKIIIYCAYIAIYIITLLVLMS
jgi:hypothetical protein